MKKIQQWVVVGIASAATAAAQAPGVTERISDSSAGVQGDQDSELPAISADGRFVAFVSFAENLVPGDTNLAADVFVRDRVSGTTERVSVSSHGREANGNSGLLDLMGGPSISRDGRFVAFSSEASNLVNGDSNGSADVFVRDRLLGTTTRVSVASNGSQANAGGTEPALSGDGRYVAFVSFADNLVPDANFTDDIFLHDRQTGTTVRVSQAPDGSDANSQSFTPFVSADGSFVYFTSFASNMVAGDSDNGDVDAYLFERVSGTMSAITSNRPSSSVINHGTAGGISGDGRFLTFTTQDVTFVDPDTNGFNEDSWLVDRATGVYELTSVDDTAQQGNDLTFAGPVSDDGRFVVLVSRATNFGGPGNALESVFLRDRLLGTTRIVSVATDGTLADFSSLQPVMTPDARVIAFASPSSTFAPETQSFFADDVFVRDMRTPVDLVVTQAGTPDPVVARSQLTYTVTVRNDGLAAATDVNLVDDLPAVTFVSATASQGSLVFERKAGRVSCALGSLAPSASATVTIVVSPARAGTLTNAARARSNELDSNPANNTASATTTVLPR